MFKVQSLKFTRFGFFALRTIFLLSLFFVETLWARNEKYWVIFREKPNPLSFDNLVSADCIKNRKLLGIDTIQYSDFPLNAEYLKSISDHGVTIHQKSKWLNAVSVSCTEEGLSKIKTLPFVNNVFKISDDLFVCGEDEKDLFGKKRRKKSSKDSNSTNIAEPSEALKLLNYSYLEKDSLSGKSIKIGIVDAGYSNLDKQDYFKKAMTEKRVLGTRDFLNPTRDISMFENFTGKDTHGREVAKCIAGRSNKEQYGVAYDAVFYLARTENAKEEKRIEEDAWVAAMEWFDSLGVRLVNSSLGYGKGFDSPAEAYKNTQMNGYSTVVAKAAQIATLQKEMIIVNSAGNSGNDKEWKGYISSPADVLSILSVGATDANSAKMGYSSIGPDYNGYIKPDISAFSKNGTSFSSPVIAGVVACILQKRGDWCNDQIKNALFQSGNLYPYKNNYLGYGVPDCKKLVDILNYKSVGDSIKIVFAVDSTYKMNDISEILKLTEGSQKIVTFRIQEPGFVLASQTLDGTKLSYEFKRLEEESYCVLLAGDKKYVIKWPQTYLEDVYLENE